MENQIKQIEEIAEKELLNCNNSKELDELRIKYLGKKGELTHVLRGMKDLSKEERPIIGEIVNKLRDKLIILLKKKNINLKSKNY